MANAHKRAPSKLRIAGTVALQQVLEFDNDDTDTDTDSDDGYVAKRALAKRALAKRAPPPCPADIQQQLDKLRMLQCQLNATKRLAIARANGNLRFVAIVNSALVHSRHVSHKLF